MELPQLKEDVPEPRDLLSTVGRGELGAVFVIQYAFDVVGAGMGEVEQSVNRL